ncbi:putative late blight resistance protein homolog R1A-10 [Nicotiana tomentosiformis]|uniref:putative late blight resistance protein homolog R1A-10 n=1 Tax=Nicotiana tomentosiformis TaxID=4098 RepID=UPI00051CA159|nr:putative late blight resistance protein homolog R1A-10 [Nicotiana tomentosiformis]
MSYPAVNSLIQTLELFQTTYPNLIHGQTAEIIDSLRASAEYFQYILENTSHQKHEFEKIEDFEGEMKTAVQHAEDLLESNISEIMKERYKNHQEEKKNNGAKWTIQDEARVLLRDLPQAMDKIDAIRKDLAQVMKSSTSTNVNASGNAAADDNIFKTVDSSFLKHASTTHLQATTVGLDHALMKITDQLLGSSSEQEVIPIWGMGGSGKSTLARKAHDGPSIMSRFDIQVWVTISQEYHLREVLLNVVHSITGNEFPEMSDDQLMDKSYKALKGRRYLIVIDDVWNTDIWDLMATTLPEDRNGCSGHDNCPSELEEIGKQIVGKCQGLPLAILVVAGHLSKVPMTEESWATVAKNVSKVITSYPDKCLAVLAMSYHHLPIHLKPCFLHLGIFPEDCEIIIARLIRLWVSEGFLKCDRLKSPEEVAEDCLEDLVSRDLVMVKRRKFDGRIKSCGMHDLLRDLSVHEAKKEKFFDFAAATNRETPRFSSHTRIYVEASPF